MQDGRLLFALEAQDVPASSAGAAYGIWLTGPGDRARRLGFTNPVGDDRRSASRAPARTTSQVPQALRHVRARRRDARDIRGRAAPGPGDPQRQAALRGRSGGRRLRVRAVPAVRDAVEADDPATSSIARMPPWSPQMTLARSSRPGASAGWLAAYVRPGATKGQREQAGDEHAEARRVALEQRGPGALRLHQHLEP